ncbi:hypothetical protein, partial [Candidatus Synechococcus spongiarum]
PTSGRTVTAQAAAAVSQRLQPGRQEGVMVCIVGQTFSSGSAASKEVNVVYVLLYSLFLAKFNYLSEEIGGCNVGN